MEITPVTRYAARYPTYTILKEHPELLRLVPARWRRNVIILTALTTACTLLSGCRFDPDYLTGRKKNSGLPTAVAPPRQPIQTPAPPITPVHYQLFLTEGEACRIIGDEAVKAGIDYQPDPSATLTVKLEQKPPVNTTYDGIDKKHRLAFEFFSPEDYQTWHGVYPTAEEMRNTKTKVSLEQQIIDDRQHGHAALFYESNTPDAEKAREDLRRQVREYISWLKSEGII